MNASETIARIRDIRRFANTKQSRHTPLGAMVSFPSRFDVVRRLDALEHDLSGSEAEDFTCDVLGFDTVLSYLAKTNPEALALIDQPVHGTICDGIVLSKRARNRGLPVLKVAACKHMKRRFPKARYVNAYPTHLLAEHFG